MITPAAPDHRRFPTWALTTGFEDDSMMGREYRCNQCDFSFSSGWSHHEHGQLLICARCATAFVLGGGQSEWGPVDGETLQLRELSNRVEWSDIKCIVHVAPVPDDDDWNGVVELGFSGIDCPCCSSQNALVQSFGDVDECPNCHQGTVSDVGSCIY